MGQGIYKVRLEHLIVSESKQLLKENNDEGMWKGHRNQLTETSFAKDGKMEQFEQ